jgi:long-chain acyl-CoA synthetase
MVDQSLMSRYEPTHAPILGEEGRNREMMVHEGVVMAVLVGIEAAIKNACPHIAHVCVVGNARPYLAALIAINSSRASDETHAAVAGAVARVNAALAPRERIRIHAIITDTWLPGAELTETLKMCRPLITDRYAALIDCMYAK